MAKRLPILAYMLLFATISMAQEVPGAVEKKKKGCGCSFSSIINMGILEGEAGTELSLQTIQGIRYGKWFTGIGLGLDYYHVRGIPLFLDIRREFLNTKHRPFVYADGGMHFAWPTKNDKPDYRTTNFSNGLFYDMGLGVRFSTGNNKGILLSAGYSYKYMFEERLSVYCLSWDCNQETRETYKYKLNRLSLKFGMQL